MLPFQLPCSDPAALHLLTRQRPERVCEAGHEMGGRGQGARILVFVTAVVLLKKRGSVTTENRHLELLEPGHDPDFRVAAQSPLQCLVGLEVTVVQTRVLVFLAGSSANFHLKHVFQAFHYLN